MPFVKGKSGNPSGRPVGTLEPKTKAWNELGDYLIGEGAERYLRLLRDLKDDEYVDRFEHLLEYFKPKLSRSEIKADVNTTLSESIERAFDGVEDDGQTVQPES